MNKKSLLALTLGVSLAVGSLVAGTYNMVQANERPAGMEQEEGRPGKHERQGKPMFNKEHQQELLTLLQIDEETFKQEKSRGKSLAEIGAEHNVGRQEIVDLIVKHMNQHLDKGITEGRLTKEKADEMRSHAAEKAQEMVDGKHMGFDKKHGDKREGHKPPMHNPENQQELLNLLQMDEPTFKQEMDSGKSLGQIAALHNVAKQDVVDLMVKHMNQHIEKGLAEGRLTAEQANEMKNHAAEKAQEMMDHPMMGKHSKHEKQ